MTLSEFLAGLGDTKEAVAESLRRLGVKGKRRNTCQCPIANAVTRANEDKTIETWSGLKIYTNQHGHVWASWDDDQIMDPQLPDPVRAFVAAFDKGDFSDLEARKVETRTVTTWE